MFTFESLKSIPAVRAIIEQGERALLVEKSQVHAAAASELARARSYADTKLAELAPKIEKAEAAARKSRAVAEADEARLRDLRFQAEHLKGDLRVQTTRLENVMRANADPRIDAARARMAHKIEQLRQRPMTFDEVIDTTTIPYVRTTRSNWRAIEATLRTAYKARELFEPLKFAVVDDLDAAIARIEALVDWTVVDALDSLDPKAPASPSAKPAPWPSTIAGR
jgi:hypothetical protein